MANILPVLSGQTGETSIGMSFEDLGNALPVGLVGVPLDAKPLSPSRHDFPTEARQDGSPRESGEPDVSMDRHTWSGHGLGLGCKACRG
eukprot:948319-Alexandrium_andersonii.AAC.1